MFGALLTQSKRQESELDGIQHIIAKENQDLLVEQFGKYETPKILEEVHREFFEAVGTRDFNFPGAVCRRANAVLNDFIRREIAPESPFFKRRLLNSNLKMYVRMLAKDIKSGAR